MLTTLIAPSSEKIEANMANRRKWNVFEERERYWYTLFLIENMLVLYEANDVFITPLKPNIEPKNWWLGSMFFLFRLGPFSASSR